MISSTNSEELFTLRCGSCSGSTSLKTALSVGNWNEDFTNFPPTTLLCGEYDALRNDTEAYFEKLKIANIPVDKIVLKGQSHNEIVMQGLSSAKFDPAIMMAISLQKHL